MDAVQAMGFWELDMTLCQDEARVNQVEGPRMPGPRPSLWRLRKPASIWRWTMLAWLITSIR